LWERFGKVVTIRVYSYTERGREGIVGQSNGRKEKRRKGARMLAFILTYHNAYLFIHSSNVSVHGKKHFST